ncbi:unnamed protein product [Parnassius apollo]|uniref:(apollo) hypothetical protein n=1 Tax=Parnassius apollo TaxID=110799 RepID=A0A8S3X4E1_PARAO|nr:unnamed protein product [Parnassius apollo]
MTVLLLMNRSVGGYPTVLFPQLAARASQDTLSLGLSIFRWALQYNQFRKEVHALFDISKPSHIDHVQLIKYSGSIPLNLPPQPENMFHQRLKEGLPQLVKNREVLAIFNTHAQAEEEKLKNDLLAIRPVSPTNCCARFGSYQTLGTLRR